MHGLTVEKHSLEKRILSRQLAEDILAYGLQSKVAVVTDKPSALLAATRKQWLRLVRLVQRERSSTLSSIRKERLESQLEWMCPLKFTTKVPKDLLEADITFATADDFARVPPDCRMAYVTYDFELEKLYMLTSWMPRSGVVVIYG